MNDFTQTVDNCKEHDGCEVIRYINNATGQQIWESHAESSTHISCRIGDATPKCHDLRSGEVHTWSEMCDSCSTYFDKTGTAKT